MSGGLALAATTSEMPPVGLVIAGATVTAATVKAIYDESQRMYVTYTLTDPMGRIYVGRASGFGTPEQVMMQRFGGHSRRSYGYGAPTLDKSAQGPIGKTAIRGREQQLIDFYGGIGSPKVGNWIRGVSKYNLSGPLYHSLSNMYFGPLYPYTGIYPYSGF